MRFSPIVLLLFAMLCFDYAAQTLMPPANAAEPIETQEQEAIAAIKKLGGKVTLNEKHPDKPEIDVDFVFTKVTDANQEHLKGLTKLQSLDLRNTKVTAEGVQKLQTALPKCRIRH